MNTPTSPVVPALPTRRPADRPLDPPDALVALRESTPIARMRYPDGHLGWLATGYDQVRAVLGDARFSSRYELWHLPFGGVAMTDGVVELPPAPLGDLTGIDPPEHTRLRTPLIGWFTPRRMRALTARVEEITAELLDAVASAREVDLVEAFARPLPARVICELLGVPYADRDFFAGHTLTLTDHHTTGPEKESAWDAIGAYLLELVVARRAHPTDDILGALADPAVTSNDFTDEELAAVGGFLLAAGFDTTANMITLGTLALLEHPEQLAALRGDPAGLARSTVEELLRWLTIGHTNVRAATADVEIDGQVVAAGESVTLAIQTANRDSRRFPDGDALDVRRAATGQLAFGHGLHHCLGHQLARTELRVALPALLTRFLELRVAVAPEEIAYRPDANLYGVHRLPVTIGERAA